MSKRSKVTINEFGTKYRFVNGLIHCEVGPAIEWNYGTKQWYLNGNLHRLDGPAIIYPDGSMEWWVRGEWKRSEEAPGEDNEKV